MLSVYMVLAPPVRSLLTKDVVIQIEPALCHWHPPPPNVVKLNYDGALFSSSGLAATGGVIRDNCGQFLVGFVGSVGCDLVLRAELWAILHAIMLAHSRGFTRVEVESDSFIVVNFIAKGIPNHPCTALVADILTQARMFSSFLCTDMYCETNAVVDALARRGDKRKQIRFEDEREDIERRKSSRIIALEEKKKQQERERKIAKEIEKKKRQQERERKLAKEIEKKNSVNPEINNKGKGKATIEIGDDLSDFNEDEEGPTKKGHKNKELYQLISSIKELGRHTYTASTSGSNGSSLSGTPLKKILENIIDFLQRKDTNELFALPDNLDVVENYRDIVKQPMDFGTMRAKLHEAMYTNFDQFKRDVFLICSNAINTNPPTSIYHKVAEKISKYAKQIFEALKDDRHHFESEELPPNKTRQCKKPENGQERRTSRRVSPKLAGRRNATETEKRHMYWPTNKPLVADVLCGKKPNIQLNENELDYKQSLLKFVEDLGPTAKRVAEGKLKALQNQQLSNQDNAFSGVQTIHQQTPQIPTLSDLFDTQKLVLAQPFFNRPHRNSGFATSLNRFVNTNIGRVSTSVPSSSKVLSIVHPTLVISGLQPRPEATINISNRSLMSPSQTMQRHSISMYDKPVNILTGNTLMQQQHQPWPAEFASHQNPLMRHFSQQNKRESIPSTSYPAGNFEDVQHFNNYNCLMQASYGKGGGLHQAAPKTHGFPNMGMQVISQMKPLGDGPVPLQEPSSSSSLPMALRGVINHSAEETPPQLPRGDDQLPNLNLRL